MKPTPTPLPIDLLLPEILQSLEKHNAAVVTAEPGAGKTTRVPPSLLGSAFAKGKEIWVLQPRRIAAKLAALRVAEEMGEEVGGQVGYQFRFENKTGPGTRLKFMTDGMLLPLAQADPHLSKVGVVILDEFHERSLALELGLAFLRKLQLGPRPDLRLLVMSATLDASSLASYLSDGSDKSAAGCPVFKSEGRVFPVGVEYHPYAEQPDLSLKIRSAVKQLLAKGWKGTALVFLPGVGEIRRAQTALGKEGLEVQALYGDLSVEEQQQALRPASGNKIILSTNIAETSLTVPGVTVVIDSGLTRQSRVSAWSGLSSLVTIPASQASATQRAGRAGRLQEGLCLRLYSKFDFEHRAAFDLPEISRSDLSKSLLDLKQLLSSGVEDLENFPWFLKPSAAGLVAAIRLLTRMGALDPQGQLTPIGRRMARFPIPPRLGRFLLAVEEMAGGDPKVTREACLLASLISEERAESEDLLEELKRYRPGFEAKRLADQLEKMLITNPPLPPFGKGGKNSGKPATTPPPFVKGGQGGFVETQTLLAKGLLCAFPDRVAKIRSQDTSETRNRSGKIRELLLSSGGTAIAGDNALTRSHELFVVVEAQETPGGIKARSLCPIEEDWLLDLFPDDLKEEQAAEWNEKAKRVEGFKRLKFGELVLDEKPLSTKDFGPETADLLFKEALSAGPQAYCDPEELSNFLNRVRFVSDREKGSPGSLTLTLSNTPHPDPLPQGARGNAGNTALPPLKKGGRGGISSSPSPSRGESGGEGVFSDEVVRETLKELSQGCRSLEDLKAAGLVSALRAKLSPKDQSLLEKLAPSQITLPSGRKLTIQYEAGKPPWGQSRLQDFFGMRKGPTVGGGEVPVVLHLLSPRQQPVQVTSDLGGFWGKHYPQIRKELSRKYPRHKWPENPV